MEPKVSLWDIMGKPKIQLSDSNLIWRAGWCGVLYQSVDQSCLCSGIPPSTPGGWVCGVVGPDGSCLSRLICDDQGDSRRLHLLSERSLDSHSGPDWNGEKRSKFVHFVKKNNLSWTK